ncbi:FAD-dependent oxidoreductase [Actinomycetospora soli]|uniref:FAD-dependent oxidoreductase n=1 Tax=Actinomycetospora soli TaxID=2893887 RepID=UPI001E357DD9|nr:FAD-dependent oxidoreductase [Actinomycetospora soli]MCD2187117.1 FAD-dependent oxidoreductase [Actinomycetospora soli]
MTISPRPHHSGATGRVARAALELGDLVHGPVLPPYTADAAVELLRTTSIGRPPSRLLAVVGATGTPDVVATLTWANENDVEVVVLDPHTAQPPSRTNRPAVALSLARADRVVVRDGLVHAGVGASWAQVRRVVGAGGGTVRVPRRPDTVADAPGAGGLRGVTLVTGDAVVHPLAGAHPDPELWWAFRCRPEAVGVVTEVVLDADGAGPALLAAEPGEADEARFASLARRHDPAGVLGLPA